MPPPSTIAVWRARTGRPNPRGARGTVPDDGDERCQDPHVPQRRPLAQAVPGRADVGLALYRLALQFPVLP